MICNMGEIWIPPTNRAECACVFTASWISEPSASPGFGL